MGKGSHVPNRVTTKFLDSKSTETTLLGGWAPSGWFSGFHRPGDRKFP